MEAVLFIGVQATGKSSFYKERFFKSHIRINLDMLKTRHREAILIKACIEAKQRFVIDNTNPTIEERATYIHLAKTGNFQVVGYYFQSRIEDALARNATRPERVPDRGILGTFKKMQLPSFQEGFDQLFYVQLTADGSFVVQEWQSGI